ncbi:MAG: pilus assembly protein TadG-related protein [Candidatus Dormibacteria bacterium]
MSTDRRSKPRAGMPRRRQRGQAAALVGLLIFFVVLGMASLAIDVGTNFDNQQQMQGAADQAALAGAQETGFPGAGVRQSTEDLAWTDLGLTPPTGSCVTGTSLSGTTCTELQSGYTVTVTYPYTPFNTTVNNYPATEVVAVDITHNNPAHGFEGFLGISSTTIHVHSAAVGVAGTRQFPFALGTRFLDLTGGGTITSYGSILVDQCSDSGAGDFSSGGGANGGLYENGTTSLLIGADYTNSTLDYYANAEAVLAADPGSTSCQSTANSSASNFTGFSHLVHFSSTYSDSDYNFAYGFNSGQSGCAVYSGARFPDPCQSNPEGDASWQDSCWQLPGGKGTVPVGWTSSYAYQVGQAVTVTPSAAPPVMCGTGPSTPSPPEPTGSMEGSYYPYQFPGFPLYETPEQLVQGLSPDLVIPSNPGSGITPVAGSGGGNPGYTSTGGNWAFQAGVYLLDGSSALPTIRNNQSFSCMSDGSSDTYPNGCVFIFENGASLNITGSGSSLNCDYVPPNSTYAPCSFFFADSSNPSSSTFSLSSGVNGQLDPIPYLVDTGSSPTTANFPVIYSNGTSTTGPTTSLSKSAVVSLSTPGNFAFNGTIYVPHGIFSSNANASSSSGQVIADSIRLQGGANSSSGVAYNGAAVAPVIGSSHLIE